jgi:hypothetical protein
VRGPLAKDDDMPAGDAEGMKMDEKRSEKMMKGEAKAAAPAEKPLPAERPRLLEPPARRPAATSFLDEKTPKKSLRVVLA